MHDETLIQEETLRIREEYLRRELEIEADRYAPWQPGEIFMVAERERIAALLLKKIDKFPKAGERCLEVGYGRMGWLGRMLSWGLRNEDLHGIELDHDRASVARRALPNADLRVGNAADLPWENDYFPIVIVSTVFSSILDERFRSLIASEIDRVLASRGIVLWYDLARDNPNNKNLKGVTRSAISELFPNYRCHIRSVTLAPPILRRVAKMSWTGATLLSTLPFLRTHLLGILVKP